MNNLREVLRWGNRNHFALPPAALICFSLIVGSVNADIADHLGFRKEHAKQAPVTAYAVQETARIVKREGGAVSLAPICTIIGLSIRGCEFRQVSAIDKLGRGDIHAFNVPVTADEEIPFVLIFHVSQQFGEIYIVSTTGSLLNAYVRDARGEYNQSDAAAAMGSFLIDMGYWAGSLDSLRDDLNVERPLKN